MILKQILNSKLDCNNVKHLSRSLDASVVVFDNGKKIKIVHAYPKLNCINGKFMKRKISTKTKNKKWSTIIVGETR